VCLVCIFRLAGSQFRQSCFNKDLTRINKSHGFGIASSASSAPKPDAHYWEKGAFRLLVAPIL